MNNSRSKPTAMIRSPLSSKSKGLSRRVPVRSLQNVELAAAKRKSDRLEFSLPGWQRPWCLPARAHSGRTAGAGSSVDPAPPQHDRQPAPQLRQLELALGIDQDRETAVSRRCRRHTRRAPRPRPPARSGSADASAQPRPACPRPASPAAPRAPRQGAVKGRSPRSTHKSAAGRIAAGSNGSPPVPVVASLTAIRRRSACRTSATTAPESKSRTSPHVRTP